MAVEILTPDVIASLKVTATPVAIKAVAKLGESVVKSLNSALAKSLKDLVLNLNTNFGPHLATTYDRCTKFKTLVSADEPVDLLDQYINLSFKCGDKIYDDFDTIEEIRARKRVVISGTGGGGKTIFTKYLWISFFENPQGQIPIFFELRRINDVTADNLIALIYHTIVSSHADVPKEVFDKGVTGGLFIFILDGFDEVAKNKKASVEKQILELARNNPDCPIIVSGRPDDTFDSWQSFSNFAVQPLTKKQVVSLVKKLEFDKATKRKFIARINSDLYAKHQSFLSTPLLASLMLLTFNQFADIPEKIHLFYEQAFDTLFARHDAMKEAFKRELHSKLSIDVFKKYFSYFCLVSYFDVKLEFTDAEIKKYLKRGLRIEGAKLKVDQFLKDLQESICVIQRDGLNLVFTHRTFQEFFAAYCLARLSKKHFRPIVEKIANRSSDNVMQMLHDMNDDLLETEYLLPAIKSFLTDFDAQPGQDFVHRYCSNAPVIIHHMRGVSQARIHFDDPVIIRELLTRLFEGHFKHITDRITRYRRKDRIAADPIFKKLEKENPKFNIFRVEVRIGEDGRCTALHENNGKSTRSDAPWFLNSGFVEYSHDSIQAIRSLDIHLTNKASKRDATLEKIFGIEEESDF